MTVIARRLLGAYGVLALGFLVLPILVMVPLSFTSSELLALPLPGISLRWYDDFFTNPRWTKALRNSLVVGAAASAIATTLGTMAAMGLARRALRGQGAATGMIMAPMIVPSVITAIAIYLVFARVGLASTLAGLVIAHAILGVPFVVITVLATLEGLDPNLARAALSLGAGPLVVFRRVTLPLILPGVVSGAILAFATSFDELIVALFIAGPEQFTLPRQMYAGTREFLSPTICAAATIVTLCSIALLLVAETLRKRSERLRARGFA
jgi:putative spermidine/putrescine transport system permease protein